MCCKRLSAFLARDRIPPKRIHDCQIRSAFRVWAPDNDRHQQPRGMRICAAKINRLYRHHQHEQSMVREAIPFNANPDAGWPTIGHLAHANRANSLRKHITSGYRSSGSRRSALWMTSASPSGRSERRSMIGTGFAETIIPMEAPRSFGKS